MKKILYIITQSELGGAQKYVLDLAKNLKNEFNIEVAFGEQGDAGELAKKLKEGGIKYYYIKKLKREILPFYDILATFSLLSLIIKTKPDIVHLNSSKISILGSVAAFAAKLITFRKIKIVYTVHGWVFNEPLPISAKNLYVKLEKFTAAFKDVIICVSNYDYETALTYKIAPKNKLFLIYNGIIPLNFFSKEEAKKAVLEKTKFEIDNIDSVIWIGSIGNLYKTKGFEYLIEAVKILKNNGKKIFAIIIGEGQEREELERYIKQLRLEENCKLAGRIDNAAVLLKAFDVYVCSSVKEGLSYTVIEAMFAQSPIVITKVGGNPDLISNVKEGIVVDSKSPAQLAEGIEIFLNDINLANSFGQEARKKALENFTIDQMVEKTKKIYLE